MREVLSFAVMALAMVAASEAASATAAPVLLMLAAAAGAYSMWAAVFRRLHDLGRSATDIWKLFVPVLNIFWFFDLWQRPGEPGVNTYGSPPTHAFGLRLPPPLPPLPGDAP